MTRCNVCKKLIFGYNSYGSIFGEKFCRKCWAKYQVEVAKEEYIEQVRYWKSWGRN